MANFAVLFFAALAFQATFALTHHNHEHHEHEIQALLNQVQYVSRDASSAIQSADSHQHVHALYSQANEFAHNIHEVVYHLEHVIHHSKEGHGQQILEHVARILSEVVHSIQQAIHHEPNELKAQLKIQVQNVAAEAQRLAQVAQQEQQGPHHVAEEVQDALDDVLTAIHQLQVRNRIENLSQQEIKSHIQEVVNQVSIAIQNVNINDEDVVEDLVHHSHHFAHHIGEIVHRLQRELHHHDIHDVQVQNVLEQVVDKLGEIHGSLEQIGHHSHGNVQPQISHLKNELKTDVHNIALQLERLVQLVHSDNIHQHETHNLRNLVHSLLARSLVAIRQLQRHLENSVQHIQELHLENGVHHIHKF